MPPGERQAPQAGRIDAADRRQPFYLVARRRDVVDQDRQRLVIGAGDEDAAQAGRVQAIAARDASKPGRQQFVAIRARDDRKAARTHHRTAICGADRAGRRPADCVIETSGKMRSSPKL